jgi:hypothetical protein
LISRLHNLLRFAILTAALSFAAVGVAAAAENRQRPIIAVGDLHGDYDAYFAILREAGLINAKGKWSGKNAILVQLGDIPDRGPSTKKIITHLMDLEKQAKRKGGLVVPVIGNHEAMNIIGDLRYVTPEEFAEFATSKSKKTRDAYVKAHFGELAAFYRAKNPEITDDGVAAAFEKDAPLGYLEQRAAWSPQGTFGSWVAGHDAVVRIGDTLFVHGGINTAYTTRTVDDINAAVRAELRGAGRTVIEDPAGPLWYRGLAEETETGATDVASALGAYDISRIVIGHTPQLDGVKSLYGGKVIAADTGASKAYGGTRSFIRIDGDRVFAVNDGVQTELGGGAQ